MQHSLFSTIWPGFAAISLCLAPLCIAQTGISTVTPTDHGKALINPNMGWTMHYYTDVHSNYGSKLEPSDTLEDFPGVSTVYLRLPWAYLEPVEGQYNWAIFDTPAQRWISKGNAQSSTPRGFTHDHLFQHFASSHRLQLTLSV